MKECCQVPLSPTGLQDTEKNGLSLKQSRPLLHRGHNVSGHQEASARACLGSVGTPPSHLGPLVNGLHSSGHMSCAIPPPVGSNGMGHALLYREGN